MPDSDLQSRTETVRAFNRFYTKAIGVLEKGYLHSPFSLTEVRVFYELRHREGLAAAAMGRELGLDPGYLSRLLARFEAKGYLRREASPDDARQSRLFLTEHGAATFDPLEQVASDEIGRLLAALSLAEQDRLLAAMATIQTLLEGTADRGAGWLLRPHRPGDFGWIVQRHGEIYSAEYGWDQRFEGVVAGIAADIIASFDPATDACWIAEKDGRRIGSVAVVAKTPALAQLRILIVDAEARGLGVGRRLVAECITFARRAGFARMTLSTYSCLAAARGLYQQAGFQLEQSVPERSYGQDLVAETWTLAL
ncbi:MarR family transcriptional regulator with acetyltransferase activity [Stella humosa]|uniref:MarR family transcriptional regulator with acetyltransferase activity n=1 Tax=Stella humosa TaxID=94 RepID=A0A3N1MKA4_9PROT|nr:bifunctional helix-turn-helix transcriptional regulator/GNAT family N-acetyltransferase [Stella humosa]ROQ01416.1 MarR family transcriptional regulator with acetyltransferase activity [Stella humosa]BBK31792.1 GNAT family N-acetyltransferase [Stella humosa]